MESKTVYPYGTNGQLPSSLGLINDLRTGGTDKALTAEQGKVIGEELYGNPEFIEEDLSLYTEARGSLGDNGWYTENTDTRHIAIPVTPGNKYRLTHIGGGSACYYGFVTSAYVVPTQNNQVVPYAGDQTSRAILSLNTTVQLTAPEDAAYLILTTVDGASQRNSWTLYKQNTGEYIPGLVDKVAMLVPVGEEVDGKQKSYTKEIKITTFALPYTNLTRVVYQWMNVMEGDVISFSLKNYNALEIEIGLMTAQTYGSGTAVYSSGWTTSAIVKTVATSEAGNFLRLSVRKSNDGNFSESEIAEVRSIINATVTRNVDEAVGGLSQVVGEAIDTLNDPIDLSNLSERAYSLGLTTWYKNGESGKHIAVPVVEGKKYVIKKVGGDDTVGIYGFLTSSYSAPSSGSPIRYCSNTGREFAAKNEEVIATAPPEAAYLILCTVDGGGMTSEWALWEKTNNAKKTLFEEVADLKKKVEQTMDAPAFRFVHWNVGHFTYYDKIQGNDTPSITAEKSAEMALRFKTAINNFKADMLGVCEDDPYFDAAGNTAVSKIYGMYRSRYVGTKYQYMCASIYHNLNLEFVSIAEVKYANTDHPNRYYKVLTAIMNGKTVKFVETHLDWNASASAATYRAQQIQKLINDFEDDQYVIIAADYNVEETSEWDAFASAGYIMANHGYLEDMVTSENHINGNLAVIDNVIVKGFALSNIEVYQDTFNLSDHAAIGCDLKMII